MGSVKKIIIIEIKKIKKKPYTGLSVLNAGFDDPFICPQVDTEDAVFQSRGVTEWIQTEGLYHLLIY